MKLLLIAPLLFSSGTSNDQAPAEQEAKTRCVDIQFQRRVYDDVFKVVKLSTGRLYWEAPNRWAVVIEPSKSKPGTKQEVRGKAYSVIGDMAERWVRTEDQILQIDPFSNSCHVFPAKRNPFAVPAPAPGWFKFDWFAAVEKWDNIISVSVGAAKLKDIGMAVTSVEQDGSPLKIGYPKTSLMRDNVKEIRLLLDTAKETPTALKIVDAAGTKQTVFEFKSRTDNEYPADRDELLYPCPWQFDSWVQAFTQPATARPASD